MKLPELPTDNLYKFMALAGITIIVLSLFPIYHAYKLKLNIIDVRGEVETLKTQLKWLKQDIKQFKDDTHNLEKQPLKEKTPETLAKTLEFIEANRNIGITAIQIETKVEKIAYLAVVNHIESIAGSIAIVAGAFLATIGFTLWYKKLQVHQDKIIQMEVKSKQEILPIGTEGTAKIIGKAMRAELEDKDT